MKPSAWSGRPPRETFKTTYAIHHICHRDQRRHHHRSLPQHPREHRLASHLCRGDETRAPEAQRCREVENSAARSFESEPVNGRNPLKQSRSRLQWKRKRHPRLTDGDADSNHAVTMTEADRQFTAEPVRVKRHCRFIDRTGIKYGRLTVVSEARSSRKPSGATDTRWNCRCECGNLTIVSGDGLQAGKSRSCGCLATEVCGKATITHGRSKTKVWRVWLSIRMRCDNPRNSKYEYYGGRGIRVCDRWRSFENFFFDMGEPPSARHSIDRFPNNNGNYEPGNCRWATADQQMRNTSKNINVTIDDKTMCVMDWAHLSGVDSKLIYHRLKAGWDERRAIFQKPNPYHRHAH